MFMVSGKACFKPLTPNRITRNGFSFLAALMFAGSITTASAAYEVGKSTKEYGVQYGGDGWTWIEDKDETGNKWYQALSAITYPDIKPNQGLDKALGAQLSFTCNAANAATFIEVEDPGIEIHKTVSASGSGSPNIFPSTIKASFHKEGLSSGQSRHKTVRVAQTPNSPGTIIIAPDHLNTMIEGISESDFITLEIAYKGFGNPSKYILDMDGAQLVLFGVVSICEEKSKKHQDNPIDTGDRQQ